MKNTNILKITIAIMLIVVSIISIGCKKEVEEVAEPTPIPTARPILEQVDFATYNNFAMDLLKQARGEMENIIISPLTIGVALTMLGLGANGETQEGIKKTLDMDIGDKDILTQSCGEIMNKINDLQGVWYDTGFAMYLDEGPTIREDFAVLMEDFFKLEINFKEFEEDGLEKDINSWADEATSGRITDLFPIDSIDHDLTSILISVSSVDCVWDVAFNEDNTRTLPFTLDTGRSIAVPTMRGKMELGIYEDEFVSAGFLPLAGGRTTLAILMPPEEVTLNEFLRDFEGDDLVLWKAMAYNVENWIFLPKIVLGEIEPHLFSEPLKQMGANDMFDIEKADFSNIGRGIYIDEIYQTAQIRISETGNTQSNITNVDITRAKNEGAEFFEANRSFLFAIIDEATGGILMIGTMANPIDQ